MLNDVTFIIIILTLTTIINLVFFSLILSKYRNIFWLIRQMDMKMSEWKKPYGIKNNEENISQNISSSFINKLNEYDNTINNLKDTLDKVVLLLNEKIEKLELKNYKQIGFYNSGEKKIYVELRPENEEVYSSNEKSPFFIIPKNDEEYELFVDQDFLFSRITSSRVEKILLSYFKFENEPNFNKNIVPSLIKPALIKWNNESQKGILINKGEIIYQ
jgi:hypothetical protein